MKAFNAAGSRWICGLCYFVLFCQFIVCSQRAVDGSSNFLRHADDEQVSSSFTADEEYGGRNNSPTSRRYREDEEETWVDGRKQRHYDGREKLPYGCGSVLHSPQENRSRNTLGYGDAPSGISATQSYAMPKTFPPSLHGEDGTYARDAGDQKKKPHTYPNIYPRMPSLNKGGTSFVNEEQAERRISTDVISLPASSSSIAERATLRTEISPESAETTPKKAGKSLLRNISFGTYLQALQALAVLGGIILYGIGVNELTDLRDYKGTRRFFWPLINAGKIITELRDKDYKVAAQMTMGVSAILIPSLIAIRGIGKGAKFLYEKLKSKIRGKSK